MTSLPDVWASRDLLVECVTELVTNARKFAEDEVAITISSTTNGGWAYLRVDDGGPGVDPSFSTDAFLPFRLLQPRDGSLESVWDFPCRRIARAHGGTCYIEPHEPPRHLGCAAPGARVLAAAGYFQEEAPAKAVDRVQQLQERIDQDRQGARRRRGDRTAPRPTSARSAPTPR